MVSRGLSRTITSNNSDSVAKRCFIVDFRDLEIQAEHRKSIDIVVSE